MDFKTLLRIPSAIFLYCLLCMVQGSFAGSINVFSDTEELSQVTKGLEILRDTSGNLSINDVLFSKAFQLYPERTPTLPVGSYWVRFSIANKTQTPNLLLQIGQGHPRYHELELHSVQPNGKTDYQKGGSKYKFTDRKFKHQFWVFEVTIPSGETKTFYLKVRSRELVLLPMNIGTPYKTAEILNLHDILFSLYIGIFLSMILYNCFIYFSTRDKIYFYYVVFAFSMVLCQLGLFGYIDRFIFPSSPDVAYWVYSINNMMTGGFITLFMRVFLKPETFSPFLNRLIWILAFSYFGMIPLEFLEMYQLKETLFDVLSSLGLILFYVTVFIAIKRGQRTAKFLLVAWTIFFIGNTLFVLKNEGMIPYNLFTTFSMTAGTAIETVLLSFALADRINTLRKDNEAKKNEIIRHLEMNEKYLMMSKQLAIDAERLKKEILITEFESLKNQVNPHFLFNSLNVLTDLVYEAQEEAVRFVNELARIYRYVLDCKQSEVTDLAAELEFIRSYIFLLKIRFEENLNITVNIPDPADAWIAPVTLQLLIENAIKHNIVSIDNPLKIDIYLDGDCLVVKNNIQMRRTQVASTGIGLKNIISRYQFLTDKQVEIANDGKEFVVKIPVLNLKFRKAIAVPV